MNLIDTNYILRYLLKDIDDQYLQAQSVIERENIFIPDFIVAEVVYVLEKVYFVDRKNIETVLSGLFSYANLILHERAVILKSLSIYSSKSVDYSDALLIAYFMSDKQNKVFTFDKRTSIPRFHSSTNPRLHSTKHQVPSTPLPPTPKGEYRTGLEPGTLNLNYLLTPVPSNQYQTPITQNQAPSNQ